MAEVDVRRAEVPGVLDLAGDLQRLAQHVHRPAEVAAERRRRPEGVEGDPLLAPGPDGPRDAQPLGPGELRVVQPRPPDPEQRQPALDPRREHAGLALGHQREGLGEGPLAGFAVAVHEVQRTDPLGGESAGVRVVGVGAHQLQQLARPVGVAHVVGGLGGQQAYLGQVEVVGHPLDQVEHAGVRRVGVPERVHLRVRGAGAQGGVQGAVELTGLVPVPGHLAHHRREPFLVGREGLGGREVQAYALARHQLPVDHLEERRVVEVEAQVVPELDDSCGERRPQRVLELVLRHSLHPGEQREGGPPSDDRRGAEDASALVRELLHPPTEQVVQRLGERPVPGVCGQGQLLDEQRVAGRPRHQHVEEGLVRDASLRGLDEGARVGPVEAGQRDPLDGPQPPELGQPRDDPVVGGRLRAVGEHDQDAFVGEVRGEEGQQVEGGPVGPLHVLDDVRHRAVGGQPPQQPQHRLEQPQP